ncbi:hypothetical protein Lqui_0029 [Legionella quinlivanii]|uniref:Uncharacterized protein n=1 Tax=Legionella quinlivanii TaxID=45073 RepID=A0A0W0Y8V1_9GAMM|nr:hypothetical protein [Legionella quinlivanii]KTD53074.1 hypothetical protein Lqui_0029 [Legionella quinlivanii]SEG16838.1 hypothetical protein SAMN02746093_02072 [Legionella quinlivanii DSM 21216]STY10454.1 Uncharacterised protein [Legionella quinlivanii]
MRVFSEDYKKKADQVIFILENARENNFLRLLHLPYTMDEIGFKPEDQNYILFFRAFYNSLPHALKAKFSNGLCTYETLYDSGLNDWTPTPIEKYYFEAPGVSTIASYVKRVDDFVKEKKWQSDMAFQQEKIDGLKKKRGVLIEELKIHQNNFDADKVADLNQQLKLNEDTLAYHVVQHRLLLEEVEITNLDKLLNARYIRDRSTLQHWVERFNLPTLYQLREEISKRMGIQPLWLPTLKKQVEGRIDKLINESTAALIAQAGGSPIYSRQEEKLCNTPLSVSPSLAR